MPSGSDSFRAEGELEQLVAATLERIDLAGEAGLEQACRDHPAQAALLRQRVQVLRELGLVQAWSSEKPPQQLGDFRLLRRIGSGGMGVVYHAVQESLGREVALKLIRPETLHVPGARERFARETTIIARLQHPGIVPIYSVGGAEELPYYAMELVRGCTLADALAELEREPRDTLAGASLARAVRARTEGADAAEPASALYSGTWEQVALRIVQLVAEALDHAHGRGVLHRDLKPSNVMLTLGGRVMLVDFGLSHSESSDTVTKSGERAGSMPFMPPELLRQGLRGVDRRSDVYSLGVTLFLLLTRRQPFQGENELEVLARILEGRPPRPRSIDPRLSWEAETVCLAALELEPDRRYATALDFARDLGRALDRRPVEARRASPWLRARRWVQRRPAAAVAVLLALVAPTAIATAKVIEVRRVTRISQQAGVDRDHAQTNFERTLRAVDSMLHQVGAERLDHVPGVDPLRIELLAQAGDLYGELARERPEDPALLRAAAESDMTRARLIARGGDTARASAVIRGVLDRTLPLVLAGDFAARGAQARALLWLSMWSSDPDEGAALHAAAVGILYELRAERPSDAAVAEQLANALKVSILADRSRGSRASAAVILDVAEALARDGAAAGDSIAGKRGLADVLAVRGAWLSREGRHGEALHPLRESLALRQDVAGRVPESEHDRSSLCEALSSVASVLIHVDRDAEALELLRTAASESECLLADYPDVTGFQKTAAGVLLNLGVNLGAVKDKPGARAALLRASEILAGLLLRDPADADLHQSLGTALLNLSDAELLLGERERALETCARSLAEFEAAIALRPNHPDYAAWLAPERWARSKILNGLGRTAEGVEALAEAPRLAGHLTDRASYSLSCLAILLRIADQRCDEDELARCAVAARTATLLARERGDLGEDPHLLRIEAWLDAR